jgi:hypothetical protein
MRLLSLAVALTLLTIPIPFPLPVPSHVNNQPAITTNLSDVVGETPEMDNYAPSNPRPLIEMPRTGAGGFYLLPGDYEYVAQSYCLHAGTFGPSRGGTGYLYAPLKGPRSTVIQRLTERSVLHPELPQHDIQVLLWGILAWTKISDMAPQYQRAAAALLTPQEVSDLNGGALGIIPPQAWDAAFAHLPPAARQVLEAEARLRQLLTQGNPTYGEIERVAVLSGEAPETSVIRRVPWGRWSRHPDGFFIRYLPSNYSTMQVQIHVPEGQSGHRPTLPVWIGAGLAPEAFAMQSGPSLRPFDPADGPAVPGNSSQQRLLPSGRPDKEFDEISKARKVMKYKSFIPPLSKEDIPGFITDKTCLDPRGCILDYIIDWNFDKWSEVSGELAGDPPRSDYTSKVTPELPAAPRLVPGAGVSTARAAAVNDLVNAIMSLWTTLRAAQVTLDRLGGAQLAGDQFWSDEQARSLIFFKRRAGLAMQLVVQRTERLLEVLTQEGFHFPDILPAQWRAYQEYLRRHSFLPEGLEGARLVGLTDAEIEATRQAQLDPQLTDDDVLTNIRQSLEAMRVVGQIWAQLPQVAPP